MREQKIASKLKLIASKLKQLKTFPLCSVPPYVSAIEKYCVSPTCDWAGSFLKSELAHREADTDN